MIWSTEKPVVSGDYWLYAKLFGDSDYIIHFVQVRMFSKYKKEDNGFIYLTRLYTIYDEDIEGVAYWQRVVPPELPEITK